MLPLLINGCEHLSCPVQDNLAKIVFSTGLVWTYYLGYALGIVVSPRLFALFSRKLLIVACGLLQAGLAVGIAFSDNVYVVLGIRFLAGLCGTVDIVFKVEANISDL